MAGLAVFEGDVLKKKKSNVELLSFRLHNILEEISLVRLKDYSKRQEITVKSMQKGDNLKFDHWISYILIGTPGIDISFKCHFQSVYARELAAGVLGEEASAKGGAYHNFLNEFCNLTAGTYKNGFRTLMDRYFQEDYEHLPEISTPTKVPSFDGETVEGSKKGSKHMLKLVWPSGELICASKLSIDVEVLDQVYKGGVTTVIDNIKLLAIDDGGEVEYL